MLKSIKSKLSKVKKIYIGNRLHLTRKVKRKMKWHGNEYGGFFVSHENLSKHPIVYSFGIGADISFDQSIIKELGGEVFAFDPTPKSIDWMGEQFLSPNLHFFPYGIGKQTEMVRFNLPQNEDFISGSIVNHNTVDEKKSVLVPLKSFDDIVCNLGHTEIDILKMDIEGAEYEVLQGILESNVKIDQLLIEFHDRFFEEGVEKSKKAVDFLNSFGYQIFGVSDTLEEVSFQKVNH